MIMTATIAAVNIQQIDIPVLIEWNEQEEKIKMLCKNKCKNEKSE